MIYLGCEHRSNFASINQISTSRSNMHDKCHLLPNNLHPCAVFCLKTNRLKTLSRPTELLPRVKLIMRFNRISTLCLLQREPASSTADIAEKRG